MALLLSRSCNLTDFPDCLTVVEWQQCLAERAWHEWQAAKHVQTRTPSLCVNWSDTTFIAPGPEAVYQYKRDIGLAVQGMPALWGLRVIDHIDAPLRFLTRATQLLRPGGLLFLTFAYWDAEGEDVTDGAESRARIYDRTSLQKFIAEARRLGFQGFGGIDWTYYGPKLGDHTLNSLVLTRRGGE